MINPPLFVAIAEKSSKPLLHIFASQYGRIQPLPFGAEILQILNGYFGGKEFRTVGEKVIETAKLTFVLLNNSFVDLSIPFIRNKHFNRPFNRLAGAGFSGYG